MKNRERFEEIKERLRGIVKTMGVPLKFYVAYHDKLEEDMKWLIHYAEACRKVAIEANEETGLRIASDNHFHLGVDHAIEAELEKGRRKWKQ